MAAKRRTQAKKTKTKPARKRAKRRSAKKVKTAPRLPPVDKLVPFISGRLPGSVADLAQKLGRFNDDEQTAQGPYRLRFRIREDTAKLARDESWLQAGAKRPRRWIASIDRYEPKRPKARKPDPDWPGWPYAEIVADKAPDCVAVTIRHAPIFVVEMREYLLCLIEVLKNHGFRVDGDQPGNRAVNVMNSGQRQKPQTGEYEPDRVDIAMMRVIARGGASSCADIRTELPPTENRGTRNLRDRARRLDKHKYVRIEGQGKGTKIHLTPKGEKRLKRTSDKDGLQTSA